MYHMTSSWRELPLAETIRKAERLVSTLGITRVTEITWLDRIGIPVYASVRPTALEGSLCVNAGKGSTCEEARVGAFMEAIEFAAAEDNNSDHFVFESNPTAIANQDALSAPFVDFCPIWGVEVEPTGPIDAIFATDMSTGEQIALPAELVFSPYPSIRGQALFGTSTNGLCSGNTLQEAALHGLCEVIERDVLAFNYMHNSSIWVEQDELPNSVGFLVSKIKNAGMNIVLRYTPNVFGLPFLQGFIIAEESDRITVSVGSGLHLSSEIAAVRALTEAAQSRLSYIHGGRDDLTNRAKFFALRGPNAERIETARMLDQTLKRTRTVRFTEILDTQCPTIVDGLSLLRERLAENEINQALFVDLSPADCDLTVLKIIVPGLECFNPNLKRVGRRLVEYVQRCA